MFSNLTQWETLATIIGPIILVLGGLAGWFVKMRTDTLISRIDKLKEINLDLEKRLKSASEIPQSEPQISESSENSNVFAAEQRLAIGVDIGSSKIAVGEFDLDAPKPITDDRVSTEDVIHPASVDSLLGQVLGLIETHVRRKNIVLNDMLGIGVAAPGQVNLPTGTLEFGPGLNVRGVPLKRELEEKLGSVTVRVDNDARCATRCELHFGEHHYENFACVFIGTGVGSGIVINGEIYYGDDFCAGEIGHATLDPEGPDCNCGSKGCLEAYVNGPAIVSRASAILKQYAEEARPSSLLQFGHKLNAKNIAMAFDENDEVARKTVHEVARYLGIGLSNYINILSPEAIVLGGGVMQGFYNHMISDVKEVIEQHCLTQLRSTPISQAKYMEYGAVLGAACLFRDDESRGIEV